MSYNLEWGSQTPGLLIYLIDLSESMKWDDKINRVSNVLFDVTDKILSPCLERGQYKERFHLDVIGYNQYTYDIFSGGVNDLIKHNDAVQSTERFFDTEKFKPQGLTHMGIAYRKAAEIIEKFKAKQNAAGIPIPAPVVINITDGYPEYNGLSDAEARNESLKAARELMSIAVPDGNVLLFNIHIDGKPGAEPELVLPATRPGNPRQGYLYDASSEMNDEFIRRANSKRMGAMKGSRFMVSNVSDPHKLGELIEFGSTPDKNKKETPI